MESGVTIRLDNRSEGAQRGRDSWGCGRLGVRFRPTIYRGRRGFSLLTNNPLSVNSDGGKTFSSKKEKRSSTVPHKPRGRCVLRHCGVGTRRAYRVRHNQAPRVAHKGRHSGRIAAIQNIRRRRHIPSRHETGGRGSGRSRHARQRREDQTPPRPHVVDRGRRRHRI